MISAEAHFDESIGHAGSRITCLAGYVYESRQANKMRREWSAVLEQHHLAYFRMSECAHGNGEFRQYREDKARRIRIASQLISVVKKRALLGMAATVYDHEFAEHVPQLQWVGGPYSLLTRAVMSGALVYFEERGIAARVIYHYESGHDSQTQADRIMRGILRDPAVREQYRYDSHVFVEKYGNPGIQSADLLAWQWYTDRRREVEGKPRRKDLAYLLEGPFHYAIHLDRQKLSELVSGILQTARSKTLSPHDVGVM